MTGQSKQVEFFETWKAKISSKKENILESTLPCGIVTSLTIPDANTNVDNSSVCRQSHSIADRL